MEFASIFKELRQQEKLTQKQLADKLHIFQSNISDWENGISRPEYEHLVEIAKIFDVSTDYLLGMEDY